MKTDNDYSKILIIKTDTPGLQYDINGIVKSFWPEYTVRVLEPGEKVHDETLLSLDPYMEVRLQGEPQVDIMYSLEASQNNLTDPLNAQSSQPQNEQPCQQSTQPALVSFPVRYSFTADPELGIKNTFKLKLYDIMCELTGRTLPWGNLTGIRPTKIAMTRMKMGDTDIQVRDYLQSRYRVSDEKTDLAIDIAHRESALLDRLDYQNGYSLYVGIPFCPTTCLYCSFTSYPYSVWKDRADDYLDALAKELTYVAEEYENKQGGNRQDGRKQDRNRQDGRRHPDTIYIGGGTPTSLDEYHFEKFMDMLTGIIDVKGALEFTCEAGRPDSITPEKLRIMHRYGVTRMSVNPQTMQQKTLDLIGRRTRVDQVYDSFRAAREAGFENINMDMILGLPGETPEDVEDTLRQIESLSPDSLTVHSLAIKRASALRQRLDEIGIDALKNTDETMGLSARSAEKMGMKPYYLYRQKNMSGNFENTGFARPGKEGIYNILIMEEVQSIIACGAGTVTKRVDYKDGQIAGITRCEDVKDVGLYISQIDDMIERKRQLFAEK